MSLSELKRLVPSAFEKQGSAKLEKAEILQMTVDHLKMLHAKGKNRFKIIIFNFGDPITSTNSQISTAWTYLYLLEIFYNI